MIFFKDYINGLKRKINELSGEEKKLFQDRLRKIKRREN